MFIPQRFSIDGHTTTSAPHPHILYNIQSTSADGETRRVSRRYSEFVALHQALDDKFLLPPKRLLAITFIPSAWIDDTLISERRAGLTKYLNDVLQSPEYKGNPALVAFLSQSTPTGSFDFEDALPSMLSRKAALDLKAQSADVTPIAAAYYENWATSPSVENIDFSKFDIIFFAFATPSSSYELSWDSDAIAMLKRLVSAAHGGGHKTKIVLSVGGWGGCKHYSEAMSSSNRTTFIDAVSSAVNAYDLDGIDIDWEYPNSTGAGQPYTANDSANLLLFFQSLRNKLGPDKIISAAVTQLPWLGSNGRPLTDVSAYAKEMNYVNIMNYDVNAASSNPGPNAPLGNPCGTNSQPSATAEAAFKQWTAAGFPAAKLLLGLPLYGYVSKSSKTTLSGGYKDAAEIKTTVTQDETTKTSNEAHPRVKANIEKVVVEEAELGDLSKWYGQQIPFNSLLASGALKKNSDGTYSGDNGYTMQWDNCSDTPFLYNTARTTVVTYDDTYSLGDKAAYAKFSGMGGCFTWALNQDDGTTLQSVIRTKLGI
ncbi:glycoside hydrolase family 18 protein [Piloderma croceum F 1598]|uniref:Glycoside hydrolase family 18 protein n=1 Tax=Piloderma croceum (strain F 1598) TaxID=765440 RepID=A0A0C3FRM9_PILCF|nr:glycoside hydrolase family 18 protein [Piloderma croceum F 1598]